MAWSIMPVLISNWRFGGIQQIRYPQNWETLPKVLRQAGSSLYKKISTQLCSTYNISSLQLATNIFNRDFLKDDLTDTSVV